MREWTDCRGGEKRKELNPILPANVDLYLNWVKSKLPGQNSRGFFLMQNSCLAITEFWSLKSRTVSEFRWTKSSLAHSRRPHQFFGATITWVPEKIFTKEESGQKPSRKLTLMKCWQFSCICKNSAVSQFSKVKRKEWKTGRNLYRLRDLRQLSNKSKEVNLVWTPVWTNPP